MEWYYWAVIIWACLTALVLIFNRWGWSDKLSIILVPLFLLYFISSWPAFIYLPRDGSPWLRHGKIFNFLKIIFAPMGILIALIWWGIYLILPGND